VFLGEGLLASRVGLGEGECFGEEGDGVRRVGDSGRSISSSSSSIIVIVAVLVVTPSLLTSTLISDLTVL